jgi:SAM-dependent methyltransferase
MSAPSDRWQDGAAYEAYVGRWSRVVAQRFLPWVGAPPDVDWIDLGCGTGILTRAVLETCAPRSVIGVEPSPGFLALAREALTDPRVEFRQGAGESLPVADASADVVVSGLVLNFIPDPAAALKECRRALRPGGLVAGYVWDYGGEMQMMRWLWDTAGELDPQARNLVEGLRFPLARPEVLATLFSEAGLRDVETADLTIPTVFRDFDDYWRPFLGGTGPAPAYVSGLAEEPRERLRRRLEERLPRATDGSIELVARAWAVRGRA